MTAYDAIVVGSGPNGLAAAIRLAEAGWSVLVREAADVPGGGTRSAALTLPGFTHDICSSVHPLALASPYFRSLPLQRYGLEWVHPPIPLAHPFDDGPPALLERDIDATAATLGPDGDAYRRVFLPLVRDWDPIVRDVLGPRLRPPRSPRALARFGRHGIRSARGFVEATFRGDRAKALFAGIAAHSLAPLETPATAGIGLVLAIAAHAVGWPIARAGSQRLADALIAHLRSLGGQLDTGAPVHTLDELPRARAVVLDVTPRQLLRIANGRFPARYRRRLRRFRYGPGVFKIDWALDGPVPWRSEACARAGTLHLGGSFEEIARAERLAWAGSHPDTPFVLFVQPSRFDPSRAPAGRHTAWAYCHVPHGSTVDMTRPIEAQVERFAPGFRDRILARSTMTTAQLERYNANLVGGDIAGGANTFRQLLFRPFPTASPYATPADGIFLCSASTPPGAGVHGMCGYHAAEAVLRTAGRR
ncbi:MAG TPA: NAD(P)/FAD-dependent oxidoreductase [Longimicrobiales bacterium]